MAETVEKPKFLLLEAILDKIDGKINDEKLQSALEKAANSLQEIRTDFDAEHEKLDLRVRDSIANETQLVYKFFNDWKLSFEAIEQYFATKQKFDLIRAGEMVKNSSDGMNYAFDMYVNAALIAMGPTEIPRLNLIINSVDEVLKEEAPLDKLKRVTIEEWVLAEGAARELEFEQKHFSFMEQALLIQEYRNLQQAIERLGISILEGDLNTTEQVIEDLKKIYQAIRDLIPMVNYVRMSKAPTASPSANLLINIAVSYAKGSVPEDMFIQTLRNAEQEHATVRTKIEALFRSQEDPEMYKEEVKCAREGIQQYGDALNFYSSFFESREGLLLEQGEKNLRRAVEALNKTLLLFDELAERQGKTPCVRCGKYNLPDRKTCESCGAILPKMADGQTSSTFDMGEQISALDQGEVTIPENLERMFTAVNQVAEGEIQLEDFEEVIDWLQGVMEEHKAAGFAQLPSYDTSKMTDEEKKQAKKLNKSLTKARELFEDGYGDWEEGLEYFREFIDVGDKAFLSRGVQVMWEGNKKLSQVQKLTQPLVKQA